jgi:hypothetical protein
MPHLVKHWISLLLFSALSATSLTAREIALGTDHQHRDWARKFVPDELDTTGTLETRVSATVRANRERCTPVGLKFGYVPFEPWAVNACQSSVR